MAALVAVLFSWMQVGQASKELRISDEGQITNRFNTAISYLGASSVHVRIGGIYALNRIVQDSPQDNPAVTSVLSAYIRAKAPLPTRKPAQSEKTTAPPADVSAALAVLANRPPSPWPLGADLREVSLRGLDPGSVPILGGREVRNFRWVNLSGSDLSDTQFVKFDFREAFFDDVDFSDTLLVMSDLRKAYAPNANFTDATLVGSDFSEAVMGGANLTGAFLSMAGSPIYGEGKRAAGNANLTAVDLSGANLRRADLRGVNLTRARLNGANLTDAKLAGANLQSANLSSDPDDGETTLTNTALNSADLRKADLHSVDLRSTDLRGADLRGAKLTGARIKGAKMDARTRGVPTSAL
ncbi:pentapeptide repeat-containing protein [Streptomyces sp. NPDC058290]|uniref:pentapeptide repeat-containing protein n=1 Tax=Streptomyces sp. NPDC058290 TaxID=3346426 RepID=UPI0036F03EAD